MAPARANPTVTVFASSNSLPLVDVAAGWRRPEPSMRLRALHRRGGAIEFVWDFASDAAAALLRCSPGVLHGKHLGAWQDAGPLGQPPLIERYRRIFEHGRTQSFDHVHWVDGRHDVVIHRVVREADGLAVTLINISANQRAQALRLQIEDSQTPQRAHRR